MKYLKDKEIRMIGVIFIKNNTLVLFVSGLPVIISIIWQPIVISATKFFLIFVASMIYFFVTYLFINNKMDITFLAWLFSLPLVIYCSAQSTNSQDWSEVEKNANWVAYLSAYFFLIALFYRIFGLYFNPSAKK